MQKTKKQIREDAKAQRALISSEERREWSRSIGNRVLPLLRPYTTIMLYASKSPEVDTGHLIERLLSAGKKVIVPIIEKDTRSLRLSFLPDPSCLVVSTFQVPEPVCHEIRASPEDVEIAIVPLIAFDARGNRLGYGAGYYDRFLTRFPHIVKIGIAFSSQQVNEIPHDADDIRMDFIVTENAIHRCNHLH